MPYSLYYHSDVGPELGTGHWECPTVYACIHKDNILKKRHTFTLSLPPRAPEVPLSVNRIVLQKRATPPLWVSVNWDGVYFNGFGEKRNTSRWVWGKPPPADMGSLHRHKNEVGKARVKAFEGGQLYSNDLLQGERGMGRCQKKNISIQFLHVYNKMFFQGETKNFNVWGWILFKPALPELIQLWLIHVPKIPTT